MGEPTSTRTRLRVVFHGELERLGDELAEMCRSAAEAMEAALDALLRADLELAERVISGDAELDAARARCAQQAFWLLTLHAPVARDLRRVVTAIQAADRLERMGDLARHVAELARRRHPDRAVPGVLVDRFAEMGRLAVRSARDVGQVVARPGTACFRAQDRADDRIDELQRDLLTAVRGPGRDGPDRVREGVDVALLARFVERFADQAVAVARRLDFVVTGSLPARRT